MGHTGRIDQMVKVNRRGRAQNKTAKKQDRSRVMRPPEQLLDQYPDQYHEEAFTPPEDATPELPAAEPESEVFAQEQEAFTVEADDVDAEGQVGDEEVVVREVENRAEQLLETVDQVSHLAKVRLQQIKRITGTRQIGISQRVDDYNIPGIIPIVLTGELQQKLERQKPADTALREYIVQRLIKCQDHTAETPVYVNDRVRRELERVANRNFSTGEELLGWIVGTVKPFLVKFGNQDIPLDIDFDLVERVDFRRDPDQTLGEALSEYLTAGIEIKTGLR